MVRLRVSGCKNNKDSSYNNSLAPLGTIMKRCNSKENLFENLPTLGLNLRKTPSFINHIEETLSKQEAKKVSAEEHAKPRGRPSSYNDRRRASNFPAEMIKIGSWKIVALSESHLVVKCYYAKKKLVWEVMEDGLKCKMEIQWSDISAIKATMAKDEEGILELELSMPPIFSREHAPIPGKRSCWYLCDDFTGGQASKCRIHNLKFPPGFLNKPFKTLLFHDLRLFELNHKPFPSSNIPIFAWENTDYMQYMAPTQDQTQAQLDIFGPFSVRELPGNMTMSNQIPMEIPRNVTIGNQIPSIETSQQNALDVAYCLSQMSGSDLVFGEQVVNQFPEKPVSAGPGSLEMNNFTQVMPTENSDSQYNVKNLANIPNVWKNWSQSQTECLENFLGISEEEHHNSTKEALANPTSLQVHSIDGQIYQQPAFSNPIQFFDDPTMMMDQPNYGFSYAPSYHSLPVGRLNDYAVAAHPPDMVYNQMDQWNKGL